MSDIKIPTLHYMVDPVLIDPVDKVMYLVRHFIYNPGFTSSLFSDYELSFRGIATRYPMDANAVASHVTKVLGEAIIRIEPDLKLNLSASVTFTNENTYTLILNIVDANNNPFIPQSVVEVNENGLSVTYKGL